MEQQKYGATEKRINRKMEKRKNGKGEGRGRKCLVGIKKLPVSPIQQINIRERAQGPAVT
jgi:hypothetical protein